MATPWDDTEFWIEDRGQRGAHLLRPPGGSAGFWTCPNSSWTYVLPVGAPLDTPPPPRRATAASAPPGLPPPVRTGTGRTNADSYSTDGSNDSRHWESPAHRADVSRHQAWSERFRDEPFWDPRGRSRNDPHAPARSTYSDERSRTSEQYGHEQERDDQIRARDARAIRSRPYNMRSDERPIDDRTTNYHPANERRTDDGRGTGRRSDAENRPHLFESPNPYAATRAPDGHPLAPRAAASEKGDDELVDPQYVTRETERMARSAAKASQDRARGITPAIRPRDDRVGIWRALQVATIAQAVNLCEWLALGEIDAYEKFQHVVQTCTSFPAEFRTEREAYLLRHQQPLERAYWVTTTGEPRPSRSERTKNAPSGASSSKASGQDTDAEMDDAPPPAPKPQPKKKTVAQVIASQWSFGTTLPVARPPASPAVIVDGPGYFGHSSPDPADKAPDDAAPGDFRVWRSSYTQLY
ncbi:hypothetical protein C8R47DRAFT_1073928 [Mycena vitilis]|nr:hypothetical protein C8R47DRAFT_1073928 [Mycena vitilis]